MSRDFKALERQILTAFKQRLADKRIDVATLVPPSSWS